MKDNIKDKKKLLKSILTGNLDEVRRLKSEQIERVKVKCIFAEQNPDGSWTVTAPCLGWVHDKVKTMPHAEYDKLVEKYEFEPLEFHLYPLEAGTYKNIDGKFVHEESGRSYDYEIIKALATDRMVIVMKEKNSGVESLSVSEETKSPGFLEIEYKKSNFPLVSSEDEVDMTPHTGKYEYFNDEDEN